MSVPSTPSQPQLPTYAWRSLTNQSYSQEIKWGGETKRETPPAFLTGKHQELATGGAICLVDLRRPRRAGVKRDKETVEVKKGE